MSGTTCPVILLSYTRVSLPDEMRHTQMNSRLDSGLSLSSIRDQTIGLNVLEDTTGEDSKRPRFPRFSQTPLTPLRSTP